MPHAYHVCDSRQTIPIAPEYTDITYYGTNFSILHSYTGIYLLLVVVLEFLIHNFLGRK